MFDSSHAPQQISVVIPNLNSPIVDQTLAALRAQEFDLAQVEVLVVGMDDPNLVHTDELVRLIPTSVPTPPAIARNIGIREARGALICFTDADCIPAPDWLARLTAPFANPDVHVVGGGVTFEAQNYWSLCDNLSWFHEYLAMSHPGEREQLPSLNLCVRQSVIERVGVFNESYPQAAGEDAEWTTRMRQAGYVLYFLPQAVVRHRPSRARFRALLRHAYLYGQHSVKVNPVFMDFVGTPVLIRRWWSVLLLAPVLAAAVTSRILMRNTRLWKFWYTWPGIWMSKMAWCLGAARRLYRTNRATRHNQ